MPYFMKHFEGEPEGGVLTFIYNKMVGRAWAVGSVNLAGDSDILYLQLANKNNTAEPHIGPKSPWLPATADGQPIDTTTESVLQLSLSNSLAMWNIRVYIGNCNFKSDGISHNHRMNHGGIWIGATLRSLWYNQTISMSIDSRGVSSTQFVCDEVIRYILDSHLAHLAMFMSSANQEHGAWGM